MAINPNSLKPNDPLRNFVSETIGINPETKSDHAKALELEKSLSDQLGEANSERIKTIVKNVVFGPQRTERTEVEMAERMGKTRKEIEELLDTQNKKTDEQAIEEVLAQVKQLDIEESETEYFVTRLREYVILVNRLNSAQ